MSARSVDAFDIRRLGAPVVILHTGGPIDSVEHVVIGDNHRRIQLTLHQGSLLDGPVRLRYDLAGTAGMEPKLLTLRRLLAFQRLGRFPHSLYPPERRAPRWTLALRALDASRSGVNQRELAAALWGDAAVACDWRGDSDYLRARVRRAIAIGDTLSRGGYRKLLGG